MAAARHHLALVCFLHQAWRDTLDQAVDMYGKLLGRHRKLVEDSLDDILAANVGQGEILLSGESTSAPVTV